jgi:hypothetical protein
MAPSDTLANALADILIEELAMERLRHLLTHSFRSRATSQTAAGFLSRRIPPTTGPRDD